MPSITRGRSAVHWYETRDQRKKEVPPEPPPPPVVWRECPPYSAQEDALILKTYRTSGSHAIGLKLGRPYRSIQYRYRTLMRRRQQEAA